MMCRLALMLVGIACVSYALAQPKVMIVHSYHSDFSWVQDYRDGLLQGLLPATLVEYFLDAKRLSVPALEQRAEQAWQLVLAEQPDVLVVADDAALRLLSERIQAEQIATVFLGINANPRQYGAMSPRLTGVLERPPLRRATAMLRHLIATVDAVDVLMDSHPTSFEIIEHSLAGQRQGEISGIQLTTYQFRHFDQWKAHVLALGDEVDAILLTTYAALVDGPDDALVNVTSDDVSRWTSANSKVPVFSFWSFSIAPDMAIGGYVVSGQQQGSEAAVLVNKFLTTGEIAPVRSLGEGVYMFSRAQLDRWRLPIPRGEDVVILP